LLLPLPVSSMSSSSTVLPWAKKLLSYSQLYQEGPEIACGRNLEEGMGEREPGLQCSLLQSPRRLVNHNHPR